MAHLRMSRLLLLALAVAGFAAVATAGDSSRLVLVGPTVIRVGEGDTIRSATVVVEGDKIKAILFGDAYKALAGPPKSTPG